MAAKRLTNVRLSENERWQMKRLAARLGLSESRTVARALEVLQTYLDGQPLIDTVIKASTPGGTVRKGDRVTIGRRQSSTSPR